MVNRGFCSSVGFKYELDCSCFRRDVQDSCLRYPGGHEGHMYSGRAEPSTLFRPGPVWPCRRAVHRPASTRPWYVRVLDSAGFKYELECSCFRRDVQDRCPRRPRGREGQMSPRRAGPSTSLPARPGLAPPPRRAPPRPDPPVVCPGFGLCRFILVPGHALHETGLQRQ